MANQYADALAPPAAASASPAQSGGLPPGIGNDQQATQATAFIRQQPWYQSWLQAQGLKPGPDGQVKLNDTQRAQLMALSLKNGIGLNHKYDSIDENGQIAEEHHKLKKVAIAAAIAGLALTGFGAAGIGPLAGALGGASAAGAGAGAAAAGIPTTAGIASATALGLPVTAGLGTAGAIGAGAAAAGAAAPLASSAIGSGAAPAIAGGTGLATGTGTGTAATMAGGVGTAASKGVSSWLTGNSASLISQGIGAAGSIYATKKQADAAEEAARLQNEQYDKALAAAAEQENYNRGVSQEALTYNRNQYQDYLSRLSPYAQTGTAASDRLSQFMGQPAAARVVTKPTPIPYVPPPQAGAGLGLPQPAAPAPTPSTQTSPLVKLQAPDGSTKDVPADQAQHFISLGAKPIGQGAVA